MLKNEEIHLQATRERNVALLMRKNYLHAVGFFLVFMVPMLVFIASSIYLKKIFSTLNVYVHYGICGGLLTFLFFYLLKKFEDAVKRNQYAIYLVQFDLVPEEATRIAKTEHKHKLMGKTLSELCEAHYIENESVIKIYRDNLMEIVHRKYGEKRKGKFILSWLNDVRSHQISLMHKQEPDAEKMAYKLKRYR